MPLLTPVAHPDEGEDAGVLSAVNCNISIPCTTLYMQVDFSTVLMCDVLAGET